MNILVIAAHSDDEVLGMGGTIKKLVKKRMKVHLCVVTEGATAQYKDKKMIEVRKNFCLQAGKFLGISSFNFLDFPDMKLDSFPQLEINRKLEEIIRKIKPMIVYTAPSHDLNSDHKRVFESTLVATRPMKSNVKMLLSYELPSISKDQFNPNLYEDITKEMEDKIKAFKFYKSEIMKYPNVRSTRSIKALASIRGIESGLQYAEAFRIIRKIC